MSLAGPITGPAGFNQLTQYLYLLISNRLVILMFVSIKGMPAGDVVPYARTFPCAECGARPKRDCVKSAEPVSPKSRYYGPRVCPWRFQAAMSSLRTVAAYAVESELERFRA